MSILHPSSDTVWLGIGLLGQTLFFARFFVQWLASERQRQSVIPPAFWFFSMAGGAILLVYAIWRADPIFIIGQASGLFIYARNIYFLTVASERNVASFTASSAEQRSA